MRKLAVINDALVGRQVRAHHLPANWYRARNFGDAMAPAIFRGVTGLTPVWVSKRYEGKFLLQGSILGWALAVDDIVWGSGLITSRRIEPPVGVRFLAVRGPLTREHIEADVPDLYCDPAALVGDLYAPTPKKPYRIGIVPHYSDMAHVSNRDSAVLVIDVRRHWKSVVDQIGACEIILSSSLHGIIVAEAFGIPAAWIRIQANLVGGDFKFRDYYLGTGRDPLKPLQWTGRLSECVADARERVVHRKQELRAALVPVIDGMKG